MQHIPPGKSQVPLPHLPPPNYFSWCFLALYIEPELCIIKVSLLPLISYYALLLSVIT